MAWYDYPIHHGYITQYQGPNTDTPHYADDLDTGGQIDIPVTSLFEGDVVKAKYDSLGSELFIKTNVPGIGPTEEYFYHLDRLDVKERQHVKRGQQVGLSGGQTSGGMHPTDPHWSTGPHIHVGFFSKYVPAVGGGSIPYGPDITPYLGTGGAPAQGSSGDACLACDPKKGPKYQQCLASVAIGFIPDCSSLSPQNEQKNDPCSQKYPVGLTTPQNIPLNALCQMEQGLGVESNTDLLYRIGFIGAGVLFIIFGLMIFSRGFMQNVQVSASGLV